MNSEAPPSLPHLCCCIPVFERRPRALHFSDHRFLHRRYLADPPLLELDGNSVSASPSTLLHQVADLPAAAVVPTGIVAQRRKSFTDHAASSSFQRPSFVPEVLTDTVTSATYVKSIARAERSDDFFGPESARASGSSVPSAFLNCGAVELSYPSANEPSSNLAPAPSFQVPSGSQLSTRSHDADVKQQLTAAGAQCDDITVSQVGV
jgi:hypothetical protein